MNKAKEISALWSQIKPQIGELVRLCHEVESHAEVTADAYQRGYEAGLNDAWEAVRTLWNTPNRKEIFGHTAFITALTTLTAQETIEKIRKYEQEKEEIKAGDEVENTQTRVKFIVTHLWKNNRGEQGVSGFNRECSAFSTTLSLVVKTGRYFPEIAEVLQKMKDAQ